MLAIAPTVLTEALLAAQVGRFYDKVRVDPILGPVFAPLVHDWDAHKVLMTSFWATVVLRSGRYRGNPLAKHRPLTIGPAHFERWLELWRKAADETLDAPGAALLVGYAERIGYGMRVGLGLTEPTPGHAPGTSIPTRLPT